MTRIRLWTAACSLLALIGAALVIASTSPVQSKLQIGCCYTQWNPSDAGAGVTISNSGRTFATSASISTARTFSGKSSGKYIAELGTLSCIVTSGHANCILGIGTSSASLTNYVGFDANSWGYFCVTGVLLNNNSTAGTYTTCNNGDRIAVAADISNNRMWIAINGVWVNSGNPAAGTGSIAVGTLSGSTWYPMVSAGTAGAGSTSLTANFGQQAWTSSFTQSQIAGFSPWTQ